VIVIIQNVAQYLLPNFKGQTLANSLLRLDVFSLDAFEAFKCEFRTILESNQTKAVITPTKVPVDGPAMVTGISAVGDNVKDFYRELGEVKETLRKLLNTHKRNEMVSLRYVPAMQSLQGVTYANSQVQTQELLQVQRRRAML
jgi:mevalonate kinase